MCRVIQLILLLLLWFMVCSDQVVAVSSWYHDPFPENLIQMGNLSSSTNRSQLRKDSMEPLEVLRDDNYINHQAAYYSHSDTKSVLMGGMATFDVYGFPNLKNNDLISSAEVWVVNQQLPGLANSNSVQAGWTVNPLIYGDSKTHFFTVWTNDGGKSTGCYNLACEGFVPVNNAPITPGDTLEPTNGSLTITIKIFKNKDDGDWWLYFGYGNNNLSPVGYWPKTILTHLADHANIIMWGGYTQSYPGNASPPMGNGQWPGKNAASVRDIKFVDGNGQGYDPAPWPAGLLGYSTHKKCYQVSTLEDGIFYYGGPGGCTE